jgi:hypothetical protein
MHILDALFSVSASCLGLNFLCQLQAGEVIDASTMSVEELCAFYEREISDAKQNDILLSLVCDIIHRQHCSLSLNSLFYSFTLFKK